MKGMNNKRTTTSLVVAMAAMNAAASVLFSSNITSYATLDYAFFSNTVVSTETPGSDDFAYYDARRPLSKAAGASFYATLGAYEERRKILSGETPTPIVATNRTIILGTRLGSVMQALAVDVMKPFVEDDDEYRWTSNPRLGAYVGQSEWSGCDWTDNPLSGVAPKYWLPALSSLTEGSYIKIDQDYHRSPALTYLMFVTQSDMMPNAVSEAYTLGNDRFDSTYTTDGFMTYLFPNHCVCSDITNENWRVISTPNIAITAQCIGMQSVVHEEPDGYIGAVNRVDFGGYGQHIISNRRMELDSIRIVQQTEPWPRVRVVCSNDAVLAVGNASVYGNHVTTTSSKVGGCAPYANIGAATSRYNVQADAAVGRFEITPDRAIAALEERGLLDDPETYLFVFDLQVRSESSGDFVTAKVYENCDTNNSPTEIDIVVLSQVTTNPGENQLFDVDAVCTTYRSGDYVCDGSVGTPRTYTGLTSVNKFTSFTSMCVYSNEVKKLGQYRATPHSKSLYLSVIDDNDAIVGKIRNELLPICGYTFDNPRSYFTSQNRFSEMREACVNTNHRTCTTTFRFDTQRKEQRLVYHQSAEVYGWEDGDMLGYVYANVDDWLEKEVSPSARTQTERRWVQTSKINFDCLCEKE